MRFNQKRDASSQKGYQISIALLVTLFGIAAAWSLWPRHGSIRCITTFDAPYGSWYTWLDKNTLLLRRTQRFPRVETIGEGFIYDLRSQRIIKTKGIDSAFDRLECNHVAASPDRKNIIDIDTLGPQVLPILTPAAAYHDLQMEKTSQDRNWEKVGYCDTLLIPSSVAWNRVGAPWLTTAWDFVPNLHYYCGDKNGRITQRGTAQIPKSFGYNPYFSRADPLGVTNDGSLLILLRPATLNWVQFKQTSLTLMRIRHNNPAPQFTTNVTPPGFDFGNTRTDFDVALSPRGDRIAWMLPYHRKSSKIEALITPIFKALKLHSPSSQMDTAIWISDSSGRHMRLLTAWTCGNAVVGDLQWSPDGYSISFNQSIKMPVPKGSFMPHIRNNIMAVSLDDSSL